MKLQQLQDQLCIPLAADTVAVVQPISSNSSVGGNQDDNVSLASITALAGVVADASTAYSSSIVTAAGLSHGRNVTRSLDSSLFFDETLRKECTLLVGRAIDRQVCT